MEEAVEDFVVVGVVAFDDDVETVAVVAVAEG